ncbi:MAG TPA: alcohol dehydrogenase catalytic domain-containing protein [Dehalococcoidales bacterium]|nr:alcohol dehydrogenase catalytic domain-containing protein [Dehalococcoidales bacterium]
MKTKAAITYEYHKPLVIEEVDLDPPGKKEVRLKVAATAICHSDVHCKHAEHGVHPLPAIGGHEICGYVDAVGEEVTYVKKGDKVIASIIPVGCGQCYYCYIGAQGVCRNNTLALFKPGPLVNSRGTRILNFEGPVAGFTEYTVVPEVNLVKMPDEIAVDKACLIACGVISGYGAVLNRAKVQTNRSCVVVGTGGVGLNAIQGAASIGAYPIIAVDIVDSKLEVAKLFGATYVINSRIEKDPVKKVFELTYGRGADYIIVSVAGIEILRQAWTMGGPLSTTCVIGHGWDERLSDWRPVEFCGGRTLTGSAMGGVRTRVDIPRLAELYLAGKIKLDELVTNRFPFSQINQAMDSMEAGKVIRNIIMFD